MTRAAGKFDVRLAPQPTVHGGEDPPVGRMSLDKQFHGDLSATSEGEMLATRSAVAGSAGYVAMERVRGSLEGKTGSFVLQHLGVMDRGKGTLTVSVVPDSGTGDLTGITGSMTIDIVEKVHFYTFDYSFVASRIGEGPG